MILAGEDGSTRWKFNIFLPCFVLVNIFINKYKHISSKKLRTIHRHELSCMLQGQISIPREKQMQRNIYTYIFIYLFIDASQCTYTMPKVYISYKYKNIDIMRSVMLTYSWLKFIDTHINEFKILMKKFLCCQSSVLWGEYRANIAVSTFIQIL